MKLYWVLLSAIILLGFCTPAQGLFGGSSLQDYVDGVIDAAKYKLNGILSLNDSTIVRIWSYFKSKYGRVYGSLDEEKQRLQVFRDHLKFVLQSNLQKLSSFQLELNEYADWTTDEFNSLKKGLVPSTNLRRRVFDSDFDDFDEDSVRRSLKKLYARHHHARRIKRSMIHRRNHQKHHYERGFSDWFWNFITGGNKSSDNNNNNNNNGGGGGQSTASFDWRSKNVVGSVKNQLNCGCCYAFAAAAVLESLYAIKTNAGSVTDLSPQQIVDCSSNGNNGCGGGNFPPSIRYVQGQGGKLATWASYPYAGKKQSCQTSGLSQASLGQVSYTAIPQGDEKTMAQALVNYGPLFIGLDADSRLFMFYKSGVLNIDSCPNRVQDMDHALVVVGYGYDSGVQMSYWIIKNSWAEKWGESGYVRLAKDRGNMCGIASMAYYGKLS